MAMIYADLQQDLVGLAVNIFKQRASAQRAVVKNRNNGIKI